MPTTRGFTQFATKAASCLCSRWKNLPAMNLPQCCSTQLYSALVELNNSVVRSSYPLPAGLLMWQWPNCNAKCALTHSPLF